MKAKDSASWTNSSPPSNYSPGGSSVDGMAETGDSEEMNEAPCLEEDGGALSPAKQANGSSQPDGPVKEKKLGVLKSLRESFKRAGEKSPRTPKVKGAMERPGTGMEGHNVVPEMTSPMALQPPPSPSFSAGSPMPSPLKSLGGLFQKKEEDTPGSPSAQKTSLSRTRSDPTMSLGQSLLKKGESIRRSLRPGKKDKTAKQEQLKSVAEASVDKRTEREEEKEEKESVDVRESYTLPEIPPTPLSVMQINTLIKMEVLEEAHLNLLSLRQEFQQELEQCAEEASPLELAKKEKDLSLLYAAMLDKVKDIVRSSSALPSRNKELLVHVARVIQEEEKREGEPGGIMGPGGWRGAWREAVGEGVQAKLGSVHLDGREENVSWLAVHLGLLGKAIVEDLESVRTDLQGSYPPSFGVFSAYVSCYHVAVGKHLGKLMQQITDLKDYYALLDWTIHRYESEKIMGSISLLPEMEAENTALCLEDDFLDQLKGKYCKRVQEDMKASLDRILILEYEDMWKERKAPETDDGHLINDIHMDIWTKVHSNAVHSKKIDVQLERRVVCACLEELKHFPKRFESEFEKVCISLRDPTLCADYQITYINSFSALQEHMEGYRDSCPTEVNHLSKEVIGLVQRLLKDLEVQFKNDTRTFLRRMMTRKWLSTDEDFKQLYSRTEKLSQQCAQMRPPYAQLLASNSHYHMVKEFVSQLMKNNYSCKNRKHEIAAKKMRKQWSDLRELFQDMTEHEWLHPLGDYMSDIIGQKNKKDIKNHLQPLVEDYPDFSKKHLAAVLFFRGLVRGRERQLILQRFTELKKNQNSTRDQSRALFSDIQVTVNTDCLAGMPISCLPFR